jgi:hypothetical protein
MATVVRMGTKKAAELIYDMGRRYYKGETLYDCYKSVSSEKVRTWEKIKRQCEELNGEKLHITGAGSHFYSCIYAYPSDDNMVIRKETAGNTYELTLPKEEYRKLV